MFTYICSPAARLGLPTDIMCNNETFQAVLDRVGGAGIQSHIIIDNVGQLVREEAESLRQHREKRNTGEISNRMNWDSYQRLVLALGTYLMIGGGSGTCHDIS